MPRPRKCRRVCGLPPSDRFGPMDAPCDPQDRVIMTVDEYETIRLIDLEGLTQEECAAQMNVARTTVQASYNEARRKLADVLVNAKLLCIEGGEYILCQREVCACPGRRCGRHPHCHDFSGDAR